MAKAKIKKIEPQKDIKASLKGALSGKDFRINKIYAKEEISSPFIIELECSTSKPIKDLSKLIEKELSITIESPHEKKRSFSGHIATIKNLGHGLFTGGPKKGVHLYTYQITLRPQIFWAKFNRHYKIFENKSSVEIVKEVLKSYKIKIKDAIKSAGKTKHEFFVQYAESDFDFIQRVMANEGIFYFYEFSQNGAQMIIADDNGAFDDIKPQKGSTFIHGNNGYIPATVSTLYKEYSAGIKEAMVKDYNFEKPDVDISNFTDKKDKERFDIYPTPDGTEYIHDASNIKPYAKIYKDGFNAELEKFRGTSFIHSFSAGGTFKLKSGYDKSLDGEYTILSIEHYFEPLPEDEDLEGLIYRNNFECIDKKQKYKPLNLLHKQPKIYSTQTATVISPNEKDEIFTDKFGRIKVKFHWDDDKKTNSCWVRVAQSFAGNNFGALFIPRVGQEVVVTFVDGNPNRPLVTGAVYNANNLPPYLPKEPNKSTIKTSSLKDKNKGYNEIRFDDKLDSEEIFIRAEKDLNTLVKHGSETHIIEEGDRTTELLGKDEESKGKLKADDKLILHKGSRHIELLSKKDPVTHSLKINKGDMIEEIKEGNHNQEIKKGNKITNLKDGDVDLKIDKGDYKITLSSGDQVLEIKGAQKITIAKDQTTNIKGNVKQKINGKMTIKAIGDITLDSSGNVNIKSMKKVSIDGKMGVDIKGMQINLDAQTMMNIKAKAMLNIDGSMVNIKAKGVISSDAAVIMNKSKAALINNANAAVINKGTASVINKATGAAPIGKAVLLGV